MKFLLFYFKAFAFASPPIQFASASPPIQPLFSRFRYAETLVK